MNAVCCYVEVSAKGWSLVQRSPTDCGASLGVIYKPREGGGPGPLGAVVSKSKIFKRCSTGCFVKVAHERHSPLNAKFLLSLRILIISNCRVTLQNCNSPLVRAIPNSLEFIRWFLWSPNEQIWKPMSCCIKIRLQYYTKVRRYAGFPKTNVWRLKHTKWNWHSGYTGNFQQI